MPCWIVSVLIAWPVLSGTLFPADGGSPFFIDDGTALYVLPPGSCFPRRPTILELLQSRHRPPMVRPFFRFQWDEPWPAWSRQPDGRIVVDGRPTAAEPRS
jgi:hypothetical protein